MSGVNDPGDPEASGAAPYPSQPPTQPAARELGGAWSAADTGPDDSQDPSRPLGGLVTFHYLRAAVRRRALRCGLFGLVGLLLAAGFLAVSPPTATTTLLLTRVAKNDGSSPMATDLSLLTTRAVAESTIQALDLKMAPEDLVGSVHAVTTTSPDVLQLTMTGPTTTEAVRRLDRFSHDYLDFRAKQVLAQSDALVEGYTQRITDLQSQVEVLNAQIKQLGTSGGSGTDKLTDAIGVRSNLTQQISALQGQKQDAALQQNGIKFASRVIDPPAPVPTGGRRHVTLVLASGLIVGVALGLGVTVLQALLSDRLWLREEVASALETSVPLSVRTPAPPRWRWLEVFSFLPWLGSRFSRRSVDRQLLARAITKAVPEPGRRQSLAVLCLGNSDEMRYAVVTAAAELKRGGTASTIVDLTVAGRVDAAARRITGRGSEDRPEVFRPSVVPSLSRGPSELQTAEWDDVAIAKARNGVTLVIADVDPGVGVDHVAAWSDRAIVAVSAGRSSVELVRTTADLVRVARLQLQHAVLLGERRDDLSSGVVALSEADRVATAPSFRTGPDASERSFGP